MAKLELSGSWILDAQSVKLTFSLIVTFYLTKTENRIKKSLRNSHMHERVIVTFSIETFDNYTNIAKQELTTLIKYVLASIQSVCFNDMLKVGKIT